MKDTLAGVSVFSPQHSFLNLIKSLFYSSAAHHFPAAIWRLPDEHTIHFATDFTENTRLLEPDLEELPAGFLCSPFDNEEGKKSFFIQADLHCTWENDIVAETPNLVLNAEKTRQKELFFQTVARLLPHAQSPANPSPALSHTHTQAVAEKAAFTTLVKQGIAAIQAGGLQKVVLSRRKTISLPDGFELLEAFDKLCRAYPSAFISLVYLPETGCWLGASPETLVSVDKSQIFRTMALAGTQPVQPGISANEANWSIKEIEEQALVSRYIISCLKQIRVREFEEDGPKTVVAGNVMHLRTDFSIDSHAIQFPQLPTVMLRLLHPTSAVCGMPRHAALSFIKHHETHDRELYSGYLGPVRIQDETHLFVNLRCMHFSAPQTPVATDKTALFSPQSQFLPRLIGNTATLFAGAGITARSQPEKEWIETELKCQTLLRPLQLPLREEG